MKKNSIFLRWNPAWSVSTILTGLLSFMVETTPTSGSIETSDATVQFKSLLKQDFFHWIYYFSILKKQRLAQESKEFNLQDKLFCELFTDLADDIKREQQEKREKQEKETKATGQTVKTNTTSGNLMDQAGSTNHLIVQNQSWLFSLLSNVFVMIGLALFAFVVKCVFEFN